MSCSRATTLSLSSTTIPSSMNQTSSKSGSDARAITTHRLSSRLEAATATTLLSSTSRASSNCSSTSKKTNKANSTVPSAATSVPTSSTTLSSTPALKVYPTMTRKGQRGSKSSGISSSVGFSSRSNRPMKRE